MTLRSPLARVLGHGPAGHGSRDWLLQRVSSVALLPLSVWFVVSLLSLPALDHATVTAWIADSWTAILLVLLVLTAAQHSQLGVRVVIEDYVHSEGLKTFALLLVTFVHVLLAAGGIFAVLKLAFGAPV
ncbi:MAG: succinate dehydrogenase, hydrophobic membrane anchor protein [Gammaproteobacteria bacterium]